VQETQIRGRESPTRKPRKQSGTKKMHVIKKKHHYKRKRSTHIHMQVVRRIGEDREKEKEKKESRIGEERETAGSP